MKNFIFLVVFLYIAVAILGRRDPPGSLASDGKPSAFGSFGLIIVLLFIFMLIFTLAQFATPH